MKINSSAWYRTYADWIERRSTSSHAFWKIVWEVANLLFYKYFTHLTVDLFVFVSVMNNFVHRDSVQLSCRVDSHASDSAPIFSQIIFFFSFCKIHSVLLHACLYYAAADSVSFRTHHNLINLCILRTLCLWW